MGADRRLDRFATGVLERLGERLWGFKPHLMRFIVADRGALGALLWFVANMPRYERTLAAEGAVRAHLWCTAISIENGCTYCTHGHALALQLAFLRDHGRAFAMDEHALMALVDADREGRRAALASAVDASGIPRELDGVRRLWALHDGAPPSRAVLDRRLQHLRRMFSVLNKCGRDGCVRPDGAHDPLNKDADLVRRYRELRRG